MAKQCKYKGCTNNQWGGGLCRIHQWLRTDKKKPKPIRKRTMRKPTKAPYFGFDSQVQVFKHVYFHLTKPVICPISGRDITDAMDAPITIWLKYFAHVLPKATYTYWRLNPRNILMVHPEAHDIVDQGTSGDRKKYPDWNWSLWDAEVAQAKEDYRDFIIEHNL